MLYLVNMPAPLAVGSLTGLATGVVAVVVLVRAVRRYTEWLEGLNEFLTEMGKYTRLEPALAAATEMVARLNRATFALIYLHDTPDSPLVLKGGWPDHIADQASPYVDDPTWPRPPLHQAYTLYPCSPSRLDLGTTQADRAAYTVLIAPISAGPRVVGYLVLGWSKPGMPATAPETCISIGEHLGVMIENFWMYEALQAQAASLDVTVADLRRREKARINMIYGILHDLRNPLQLVRGFLTLAVNTPGVPEGIVKELRVAKGAAARAIDLAETLLLAEIPERDRPNLEVVDVASIMTEVTEQSARAAEAAGVSLLVDVSSDLPPVTADRLWLYRILDNLILNALRHTAAGGQVTIRANRHNAKVTIQVGDTGRGMPQDELQGLLNAPLDDPPPGGRLGLWIVRRLVAGMGSELQGESQPGKGTSLHFALPVAQLQVQEAAI